MEPEAFAYDLRRKVYDASVRTFAEAIAEALPDLPVKTVYWRLILIIGANLYAVSDTHRLAELSHGLCDPGNLDELFREVTAFVLGGLTAPSDTRPNGSPGAVP
jgi:hypothetical protein